MIGGREANFLLNVALFLKAANYTGLVYPFPIGLYFILEFSPPDPCVQAPPVFTFFKLSNLILTWIESDFPEFQKI